MHPIEFSSVLPAAYRCELEQLLYFNRLQSRAAPAIAKLVERYGQPCIQQADGRLQVGVGNVAGVQALFAFGAADDARRLAGLAIYTREGEDLVLIHIAVARAFSFRGARRPAPVAMRLVHEVREVARRLNGVTGVVLYYPAGLPQRLPIRRWASVPASCAATTRRMSFSL
jgi:hypothetical protein